MVLHQTKKLLHSKRNHQQNEKGTTEWGNIFANNISDKGLINIQNIQRTSTIQHQEDEQTN